MHADPWTNEMRKGADHADLQMDADAARWLRLIAVVTVITLALIWLIPQMGRGAEQTALTVGLVTIIGGAVIGAAIAALVSIGRYGDVRFSLPPFLVHSEERTDPEAINGIWLDDIIDRLACIEDTTVHVDHSLAYQHHQEAIYGASRWMHGCRAAVLCDLPWYARICPGWLAPRRVTLSVGWRPGGWRLAARDGQTSNAAFKNHADHPHRCWRALSVYRPLARGVESDKASDGPQKSREQRIEDVLDALNTDNALNWVRTLPMIGVRIDIGSDVFFDLFSRLHALRRFGVDTRLMDKGVQTLYQQAKSTQQGGQGNGHG